MEDEEDDLYGSAQPDNAENVPTNGDAPVKAEQMEVSEEEEDSEDVRSHHITYIARNNILMLRHVGYRDHN